ncbi:MAG: TIGR03790 family protein [Candidatus Scalindua sp. SCAELEC01]|nr:TIGR03790 family protein [Planctomycetota bacterium]RZV73171.1 MAG: TIGR03790 family protein [Candidatus Scalindua sp. SCAELEC01]
MAIVIAMLIVPSLFALSPEDLVIVYNKNMKGSEGVTKYYASKRRVPSSNIVEVDAPQSESLKRHDFETKMIPPIRYALKQIKEKGRTPSILLMYGIPLRVEDKNNPQLYESYKRRTKDKVREYKRLVLLLGSQLESMTNRGTIITPSYKHQNSEAIETDEIIFCVNKTIKAATEFLATVSPDVGGDLNTYSKVASLLFRMVGMAPLVNNTKERVSSESGEAAPEPLQNDVVQFSEILNWQLVDMSFRGFTPEKALEWSTIIRVVNGVVGELIFWDAQQKKALGELTSSSVDSELTLVFAENYQLSSWLPNPFLTKYDNLPGVEWMREKTIMVGRLDAPTPDMVKRMIDDAIKTEETGLFGTFYIDARGLPGSGDTGSQGNFDGQLRNLYTVVKEKGCLPVVLDDSSELFPEGSCPNAALYVGWHSEGKYVDSFGWETGAVGFHVADTGANTLRLQQSEVWCKRMVEEGVTATIGAVEEPHLSSFPLPEIFFPLLMSGEFSLLEAYFKSVPYLSWRQVLLGDPLYRPFKNNPCLELSGL